MSKRTLAALRQAVKGLDAEDLVAVVGLETGVACFLDAVEPGRVVDQPHAGVDREPAADAEADDVPIEPYIQAELEVQLRQVDAEDVDAATNPVDGESVPARHFGIVLEMDDWRSLAARLEQENSEFLISPQIRFAGEIGEQATLFIRDPSGNALEFKSFADSAQLFAT